MSYQYIELEKKNNIGYIWMNNGPYNELTPDVMDELMRAHDEFGADDEVWGVILASKLEKYFCNGLSPDYVLGTDFKGRQELFVKLTEMMQKMYAFEKPQIAAIDGHCMAGGAVLGILCDFRYMGSSKARYSFTEVAVGLVVPRVLLNIIENVVGTPHLRQVAMLAGVYKAEEAGAINLVDEVTESGQAVAKAEEAFGRMFQLPLASVRFMKKAIREDVLARMKATSLSDAEDLTSFLSENFMEGLNAVKERRRPKFANP